MNYEKQEIVLEYQKVKYVCLNVCAVGWEGAFTEINFSVSNFSALKILFIYQKRKRRNLLSLNSNMKNIGGVESLTCFWFSLVGSFCLV